MSHAQDQADEVSALEAIYGDAFDSGGGGADGLSIAIQPSLGGLGERAWVSCRLRCRYTPEYPDAPADLSLEALSGLSEAQASELRGELMAAALENAGTPYVFAVAERVREWLTAHNEKPSDGSAFDDMMRRARAKEAPALASAAFSREDDPSIKRRVVISAAEEDTAEKRKRDGTPVTPESFSAWLAAFQAETAEQARAEEAAAFVFVLRAAWDLTKVHNYNPLPLYLPLYHTPPSSVQFWRGGGQRAKSSAANSRGDNSSRAAG
jgi:hypothetical protein